VLTRREEQGFTLVELTVAMGIMLLVAGALLAALESGTNAERHSSRRIDDEQSVRVVLAQLTRDVRNSNGLLSGTALDEVDLGYLNGDEVLWTFDPNGHVLQRSVPDPHNPGSYLPGISVRGLTNADGTVFRILAPDGSDLLSDASASSNDVTACATTVAVSVTASAHPPSAPFTETAHAPVDAPGVDRRGCP
jgi:prepilin-type N-terminal cleavage/methylation domain-containing protein